MALRRRDDADQDDGLSVPVKLLRFEPNDWLTVAERVAMGPWPAGEVEAYCQWRDARMRWAAEAGLSWPEASKVLRGG